jgi:hypothetical protein
VSRKSRKGEGDAAPYRAMPLPARPRESWRPLLERALVLFNAAALAGLALWWGSYPGTPSDDKANQALLLAGVGAGGALGFLGWFSYALRLRLIFLSGLLWGLVGAVTVGYGLTPFPYVFRLFGDVYSTTTIGVVLVAVGIGSVVTFLSRERTRYVSGRAP